MGNSKNNEYKKIEIKTRYYHSQNKIKLYELDKLEPHHDGYAWRIASDKAKEDICYNFIMNTMGRSNSIWTKNLAICISSFYNNSDDKVILLRELSIRSRICLFGISQSIIYQLTHKKKDPPS